MLFPANRGCHPGSLNETERRPRVAAPKRLGQTIRLATLFARCDKGSRLPMSEDPFDTPRIAINRVYTRHGDEGETALAGGQRVPKDSVRIEAYGTVDELNAFLGAARAATVEA